MPDADSRISALERRVDSHADKWDNLQGDGNIRVENGKISLTAVGAPANLATKKVIITDNGTADYYMIPANFVGPVT